MIAETETLEPRMMRGYEIVASYPITQRNAHSFLVPSKSSDKQYEVSISKQEDSCTCPDHTYRKTQCKHIVAVRLWLAPKEKLTVRQVEENETVACKFCNSLNVVKYGTKNGKQNYYCKSCKRKFVNNGDFQKLKFSPQTISLTLDLYFKGVSLRKISDHLRQFHSLSVSYGTIHNWLEKYVGILDDYVSTLELDTSSVWHADEMMVNVGGNWKYLWNVIDEGTRFQLASVISEERKIEDARKVFQVAKQVGSKKPKYVVTDGLKSYEKAVKREFHTRQGSTTHIKGVGIRSKVNNNVIDRLHGTLRERNKVQRGLKKDASPTIDGERIYYNFIRPHQRFDGMTPAEVAGVDLELGENKWLGLLKKAMENVKG
jgi:putative transposase